jgi:hypothetical protein
MKFASIHPGCFFYHQKANCYSNHQRPTFSSKVLSLKNFVWLSLFIWWNFRFYFRFTLISNLSCRVFVLICVSVINSTKVGPCNIEIADGLEWSPCSPLCFLYRIGLTGFISRLPWRPHSASETVVAGRQEELELGQWTHVRGLQIDRETVTKVRPRLFFYSTERNIWTLYVLLNAGFCACHT